jgi:glycerophosphoryl diester phosphodiesterase
MRKLQLDAVGFHRLNINKFALDVANRFGLFTYAYTVNRPDAAIRLAQRGIDAVVTDRPDILLRELSALDIIRAK